MPEILPETETVIIKDGITLTLSGSCHFCGYCCYKFVTDNCLTDNGRCRYLLDADENGYMLCRLQRAIGEDDENFLSAVGEEELAYYTKYCECFPQCLSEDPNLAKTYESLVAFGWPPEQCGYTLTKE